MKRRRPSRREQAEILLRQGGKCAWPNCTVKLPAPGMVFDHTNQLSLSGNNSTENFRALCAEHNRLKTYGKPHTSHGSDAWTRRHVRNLTKPDKPRRSWPSRKIGSRGFDKTISRHFDGTVTRKQT